MSHPLPASIWACRRTEGFFIWSSGCAETAVILTVLQPVMLLLLTKCSFLLLYEPSWWTPEHQEGNDQNPTNLTQHFANFIQILLSLFTLTPKVTLNTGENLSIAIFCLLTSRPKAHQSDLKYTLGGNKTRPKCAKSKERTVTERL